MGEVPLEICPENNAAFGIRAWIGNARMADASGYAIRAGEPLLLSAESERDDHQ